MKRSLWCMVFTFLLTVTPVWAQGERTNSLWYRRTDLIEPLALTGILVLISLLSMPAVTWLRQLVERRWTLAWRAALQHNGWLVTVAAGLAIFIALLVTAANASANAGLPGLTVRVTEMILPLIIGLQAAFAFAPDDEPALEILAACPRPLYWVLLERLTSLFCTYGALATLIALLVMSLLAGDNLLLATVRWFAPSLLFTGIVTRATMVTRRASFGMLVVIMLYGATLIGGDLLTRAYPVFSPLFPFLQPQDANTNVYILNRVLLSLIGLALVVSTAWLTRSDERMLGR